MSKILLHKVARQALTTLVDQPPQALLIVAPSGSGKGAVVQLLASELLGVQEQNLKNYPYFKLIQPDEKHTVSIDAIREAIRFTTLKTSTKSGISRVIVIENSQNMTVEAQNALLKTLEEPPSGTMIILTAPGERQLLPTVLSRLQIVTLPLPDRESIKTYFSVEGYTSKAVDQALLMSGGLPGLMHSLLNNDKEHPLVEATLIARSILGQTPFERLTSIDGLAKNKQLCFDVLFILEQMASISMRQNNKKSSSLRRWQKILSASHAANKQLLSNAQTKLVLLHFMLAA